MSILSQYKYSSRFDVRDWVEDNIPNLTPYQRERIREDELIRVSNFEFVELKQKKPVGIFYRFSMIPFFISLIFLFVLLPINYIVTGKWVYNKSINNFFGNWQRKIGL